MKTHIEKNIHGRLIVHWTPGDRDRLGWQVESILRVVHNRYTNELVAQADVRNAVASLLADSRINIPPGIRRELEEEIKEAKQVVAPLTEPTDYELTAYCDEERKLVCVNNMPDTGITLTIGKEYDIRLGSYRFSENFVRKRAEWDEAAGTYHMVDHHCSRNGSDRYIGLKDDRGIFHRFMAHKLRKEYDHYEDLLWALFRRPVIPTVKEVFSDRFAHAMDALETHEVLSNFDYYPGQKDFIARVACKDFGLAAAETGVGKTLMAISLMIIKGSRRVLVMAPKGTVKGSDGEDHVYDPAQWEQEINRFAPHLNVRHLFSRGDYESLSRRGREIPEGVYITYPDAYFMNGAREHVPDNWDEWTFREKTGLPLDDRPSELFSEGVGSHNPDGMLCVAKPSVASEIGDQWDMVILDEAHLMKNPDARRTRRFLRLQAPCRYALTATPISNMLPDVFTLMGWLSVPNWYLTRRRNAVWPYGLEDRGRFVSAFMVHEKDHTAAAAHLAKTGKRRSFSTPSPAISNPARLLKTLKPVMSYIDKRRCNPDLVPCDVKDVRVPFGQEQADLYNKLMDPRVAGVPNILAQQGILRAVCCDPVGVVNKLGVKGVKSNLNPKLVTILNLTRQCLEQGEQALVVGSRLNQLTEIQHRLREAGVSVARVDSTAKDCAAEAGRFKRGEAQVCLMGIMMAQGYSFQNCPNLIIGSLEWTYSSKTQAMGRVWRLNSPKPVTVWCVLNENSVEEVMFERIANKADAATLCLYGKKVPGGAVFEDAASVVADHIVNYRAGGAVKPETDCEAEWPKLRQRIADAVTTFERMTVK